MAGNLPAGCRVAVRSEDGPVKIYAQNLFAGSYNKVTVKGAAASRVFSHLKAEAVRMGEKMV